MVQRRARLKCPFCRGMEELTPPAKIIYRSESESSQVDDADWLVRVVPNKYPAMPEDDTAYEHPEDLSPYAASGGNGVQEVIVLSPRHLDSLSELNSAELQTAFAVFQDRLQDLQATPEIRHSALFMNCRAAAGASIEHVHAQLIGAGVCTEQVKSRFERLAGDSNGRPGVLDQLCRWELREQTRVLDATDDFLVFCPFASRLAYQMWIVPRQTNVAFASLAAAPRQSLAALCQRWIIQLESLLGNPAYNLVFHLPPNSTEASTAERKQPWFIEIFPRLDLNAGFETASECWINLTSPESAAKALRDGQSLEPVADQD